MHEAVSFLSIPLGIELKGKQFWDLLNFPAAERISYKGAYSLQSVKASPRGCSKVWEYQDR